MYPTTVAYVYGTRNAQCVLSIVCMIFVLCVACLMCVLAINVCGKRTASNVSCTMCRACNIRFVCCMTSV